MTMFEKIKEMWLSVEQSFATTTGMTRLQYLEKLLLVKNGKPNVELIQAQMQKGLNFADERVTEEYTAFLNVINKAAERYLAIRESGVSDIPDLYKFIWEDTTEGNYTGVTEAGIDLDYFDFEVRPRSCTVDELLATGSYYPVALADGKNCKMYQVFDNDTYQFFANETVALSWVRSYNAGTSEFLDVTFAALLNMASTGTLRLPLAVLYKEQPNDSAKPVSYCVKDTHQVQIKRTAVVNLEQKATIYGLQNVLEVTF